MIAHFGSNLIGLTSGKALLLGVLMRVFPEEMGQCVSELSEPPSNRLGAQMKQKRRKRLLFFLVEHHLFSPVAVLGHMAPGSLPFGPWGSEAFGLYLETTLWDSQVLRFLASWTEPCCRLLWLSSLKTVS